MLSFSEPVDYNGWSWYQWYLHLATHPMRKSELLPHPQDISFSAQILHLHTCWSLIHVHVQYGVISKILQLLWVHSTGVVVLPTPTNECSNLMIPVRRNDDQQNQQGDWTYHGFSGTTEDIFTCPTNCHTTASFIKLHFFCVGWCFFSCCFPLLKNLRSQPCFTLRIQQSKWWLRDSESSRVLGRGDFFHGVVGHQLPDWGGGSAKIIVRISKKHQPFWEISKVFTFVWENWIWFSGFDVFWIKCQNLNQDRHRHRHRHRHRRHHHHHHHHHRHSLTSVVNFSALPIPGISKPPQASRTSWTST